MGIIFYLLGFIVVLMVSVGICGVFDVDKDNPWKKIKK